MWSLSCFVIRSGRYSTSFPAMLQPAVEGGSVESSLALPCPTVPVKMPSRELKCLAE